MEKMWIAVENLWVSRGKFQMLVSENDKNDYNNHLFIMSDICLRDNFCAGVGFGSHGCIYGVKWEEARSCSKVHCSSIYRANSCAAGGFSFFNMSKQVLAPALTAIGTPPPNSAQCPLIIKFLMGVR